MEVRDSGKRVSGKTPNGPLVKYEGPSVGGVMGQLGVERACVELEGVGDTNGGSAEFERNALGHSRLPRHYSKTAGQERPDCGYLRFSTVRYVVLL